MPKLRDIVISFVKTEKALRMLEENKLTVIVKPEATKREIKEAFEETLKVKVEKVNTLRTPKGEKKAYVKLAKEYNAMKIAEDLGIL
jgi:large subunit ribosomal protein L23